MLSHADVDGEIRVLLTHFGLTARDVVGEQYARVTPANLLGTAPLVTVGQPVSGGPIASIVDWSRQHASGEVHLLHLVGGMLSAQTELMTSFESAFTYIGESRRAVASSYEAWLATQPLNERRRAGASLREWLQKNNPRAPVSVAGFATDDVSSPDLPQQDLVGISPEGNALAYLVASRDLAPPLAVGLFGDWGSGKSFLMRDVRDRVRGLVALCAEQPQHEAAIWKNIQHIEFNAWEYVQGDLWAGLLEKIFQKLGSAIKTRTLVEERQEPVRTRLTEQVAVVETAEAAKQEIGLQVAAAADEVTKSSALLTQRKNEAGEREGTVPEATKIAATKALSELWSGERVQALGADAEALLDALGEAREEVRQGKALLGPYWNWRRIAVLSIAIAVVPVVTWLLQVFTDIGDVASTLAGLAAGVPVLTGWLRQFTSWSQSQRHAIEVAQQKVRATHQAPIAEAEQALARARARHAEVVKALADQTATVAQENQRALELEEELKALTPGRVFAEFADKRTSDYRAQLGFLGTVRADLRTIEAEITTNNRSAVAPPEDGQPTHNEEIPNRIVLYIDDLDRCPPAKVVQVLEAVHLLLAFPLFVVFVAVDSRWLSSALLEQLHALRAQDDGDVSTDGLPTARDYLEKIFQLPFWVQPLSGDDRRNIVSGLLGPTVRGEATEGGGVAPGQLKVDPPRTEALETMISRSGTGLRLETNTLALTTAELEFVASLGPLLGDTPRRIKRFVNTVQFLLSVRPPLVGEGQPSPRLAAALFAAIHEGTPSIAREFFKKANENEPLDAAMKAQGVVESERLRLAAWLAEPGRQHWRQAAPRDIGERCEMVQRLSFDRPTY